MPDSGKKILISGTRTLLFAGVFLILTSCVSLPPERAEETAACFLPADSKALLYADFEAGPSWRGQIEEIVPENARDASHAVLSRCRRVWAGITSFEPFQGVFVFYGGYTSGDLRLLLSGRPDWTPYGKDGYSGSEGQFVVRVPESGLLVVEYGYGMDERPVPGAVFAGKGEALFIDSELSDTGLPVSGLELSFFKEQDRYRMSGKILAEGEPDLLLVMGFKGYLTLWSRTGGDSIFNTTYRQSSLTLDEQGDLLIDNLYFADPFPFLLKLMMAGVTVP